MSGLVTAVQPLGSETLVHLDTGGAEVIATAPDKLVPRAMPGRCICSAPPMSVASGSSE